MKNAVIELEWWTVENPIPDVKHPIIDRLSKEEFDLLYDMLYGDFADK